MPLHSPLLEQSLLLGFPPLSDMLKFSGSLHVPQVTPATEDDGACRQQPSNGYTGKTAADGSSVVDHWAQG